MVKKFNIRKEPKKPERKTSYGISMLKTGSVAVYDIWFVNLPDILNWVKEKNLDPRWVNISVDVEQGWECSDVTASITGVLDEEPEEYFQRRMDTYNKEKANYDEWYEKNKDKVKNELQHREDVRREKAQKTLAKLKEQEEKIKQKREKLEATLGEEILPYGLTSSWKNKK